MTDTINHVDIRLDFTQKKVSVRGAIFWHEQSALQSVAVRRSTGNDVSGHYFCCCFLFSPPPSRPFLIEGGL